MIRIEKSGNIYYAHVSESEDSVKFISGWGSKTKVEALNNLIENLYQDHLRLEKMREIVKDLING